MKNLTVTKIVTEIRFEGAFGKLEAKVVSRDNHSKNICKTNSTFHVK